MKKNPSWERSKNASRSSGVLSWLGSGKAVGIAFPSPEKWGGYLLRADRRPVVAVGGLLPWRRYPPHFSGLGNAMPTALPRKVGRVPPSLEEVPHRYYWTTIRPVIAAP